ncbi:MBL fold metallo-hydrolase [Siccibacter colletis]|uniref:MBL fold metallo-hydrolase n=1 Tax=Siccibacter colletis TaxID=1505757 RepID=UPI003CF78F9B
MKASLLLAALVGAVLSLPTQAATPATSWQMSLGDWRITAVSDGSVVVPLDKLLTHITPEALVSRMAAVGKTPQAETAINTYVIDTGRQRYLVDTGAGALLGNAGGHLPDNLRAAGIPPESIDQVLLTHIHGDHSGGLQHDGVPVFPNATVRVDRKDVDFWLDPAHASQVEACQRHTFAESERSLRPVIDAGKLQTFTAPVKIAEGIEAIPAPGHTPGSVIYRVTHGGKTLLLWGDIIHAEPVQMPQPEVAIHFDVDQTQAVATRKQVLEKAAADGDWIASAHIAFPGIGKVEKNGQGYRWMPAPQTQR